MSNSSRFFGKGREGLIQMSHETEVLRMKLHNVRADLEKVIQEEEYAAATIIRSVPHSCGILAANCRQRKMVYIRELLRRNHRWCDDRRCTVVVFKNMLFTMRTRLKNTLLRAWQKKFFNWVLMYEIEIFLATFSTVLWKMLSSLHKAKAKWCGIHVKWGSQVKPNMGWRDIDNDQTWAAIIGVEACASCDISDVCSKCKVWSGLRGPLAESSGLFDRVICERPAASFNFKCTFLAAVKSGLLIGSSFLIVAEGKCRCGGETWEGGGEVF